VCGPDARAPDVKTENGGDRVSSIEHFVGRPFKEISQGEDKWDWGIVLEGDAVIRNKNKKRTKAPSAEELEGKVLANVILSEMDTRLMFTDEGGAREEIVLTPTDYTVGTPQTGEYYPQRPVELQELPPDPSEERVADGPEEQEEPEEDETAA